MAVDDSAVSRVLRCFTVISEQIRATRYIHWGTPDLAQEWRLGPGGWRVAMSTLRVDRFGGGKDDCRYNEGHEKVQAVHRFAQFSFSLSLRAARVNSSIALRMRCQSI
jgi:hypothetical protein